MHLRALYFPLRSSSSVSYDTVSPCCGSSLFNSCLQWTRRRSHHQGDEPKPLPLNHFFTSPVFVMATPTEENLLRILQQDSGRGMGGGRRRTGKGARGSSAERGGGGVVSIRFLGVPWGPCPRHPKKHDRTNVVCTAQNVSVCKSAPLTST